MLLLMQPRSPMKLSRKLHRQIEIKIRQAMANEQFRTETTVLPERPLIAKPSESDATAGR
jgi:hypothetical protein